MHTLFIVFYFFLSMKEVSASVKAIAYFYKVIVKSWTEQTEQTETTDTPNVSYFKLIILMILSSIRIIPQLVQISFCFWFCYINIYVINQSDTSTDLIQNFAALAIMLEFDNFVMDFFRYIRFKALYETTYQCFIINQSIDQKTDIFKQQETDIEQQIKNDKRQLDELVQKLDEGSFNWEEKYLDEEMKRIRILKENIEESRRKLEDLTTHDFLDDLRACSLQNLIYSIPRFIFNYFKSRNGDVQILMSEEKFSIIDKYRLNKMEKKAFDWIGFLIITLGIGLVIFIFKSE